MLKLIINNQEVELGSLNGIEIQNNGGFFDFNSITGSYTIPFNLPITPRNNLIFDFPYKVNVNSKEIRLFDAEIWHSGIIVLKGIIEASEFDYDEFSCTFFPNNGTLIYQIKEEILNKLTLGGTLYVDLNKTLYDINTDLYVLYPVKNEYFNKDNFSFFPGSGNNYQNEWNNSTKKFKTSPVILTPFPLLWQVLRMLFESLGFKYEDNYFTSDDLKAINIFSIKNTVVSLQPGPFNLAEQLPTITVGEFIISIQNYFNCFFNVKNNTVICIDRNSVINSRDTYIDFSTKIVDNYKKTIKKGETGFHFKVKKEESDTNISDIKDFSKYENSEILSYLPSTPIDNKLIFKDGFAYIGETNAASPNSAVWFQLKPENDVMQRQTATVVGEVTTTGDVRITVTGSALSSPVVLDVRVLATFTPGGSAYYIKLAIAASEIVEFYDLDMSLNEFIILTQKKSDKNDNTFNIAIDFGTQIGIIPDPTSVGSYAGPDNPATYASQNDYFDGKRETVIEVGLTPLPNMLNYDYLWYIKNMPKVEMGGNKHVFYGLEKYKYQLRLSQYKGLQDVIIINSNNDYYDDCPFSTCGGTCDPYYISARFSYQFYWKSFLAWYQDSMKEEFEFSIMLTLPELKNFDFTRKIKILDNLFIAKSFSVQLTRTEVLKCKFILYKANK